MRTKLVLVCMCLLFAAFAVAYDGPTEVDSWWKVSTTGRSGRNDGPADDRGRSERI